MILFIINPSLLLIITKTQYLHAIAILLVEVDATLLLLLGTDFWYYPNAKQNMSAL